MSKQEWVFVLGSMSGFYIAMGDPEGITGIRWLDTVIFGLCGVVMFVVMNYTAGRIW